MKEIFEKIKGREWDWFGECSNEVSIELIRIGIITIYDEQLEFYSDFSYSLPDLLANKSWCKAVWGEQFYNQEANKSYKLLREKGEEACLTYIKKTMQ